MTDRPGTDQLEGRLRALHADTDSVILADSSAVRRRGDRRRRMTQAGTVLGVAALAVGVVGIASTLTDRPAAAPPAATSPSPQDSVTTTVVAADPFLRAADLALLGTYEWFVRTEPTSSGMRLSCLSDPASWGATTTQSQEFSSDLDATFVQTVLQFPDVASATAATQRPLRDFATCPEGDPSQATVADRDGAVGAGDQAFRLSRSTTPKAEADLGYNEVAVARAGSVVIVLDWSSMGSPVEGAGWVWTPEQLGIALDRAVA